MFDKILNTPLQQSLGPHQVDSYFFKVNNEDIRKRSMVIFFKKGCLLQILLDPFLNTLPYIKVQPEGVRSNGSGKTQGERLNLFRIHLRKRTNCKQLLFQSDHFKYNRKIALLKHSVLFKPSFEPE